MGLSHKNVFALFIYLFRLILLWGNIFGKFSWKVNKKKLANFCNIFFVQIFPFFAKFFAKRKIFTMFSQNQTIRLKNLKICFCKTFVFVDTFVETQNLCENKKMHSYVQVISKIQNGPRISQMGPEGAV